MNKKKLGGSHRENHFQQMRLNYGFSQEELAKRLHCSVRTIQRLEEGYSNPSMSLLQKMALLYKCDYSKLFPNSYDEMSDSQTISP